MLATRRRDDDLLADVEDALPVALAPFDPAAQRSALVVVDEVNAFTTPGTGNLAPPAPDPKVERMLGETDALARRFEDSGWPILTLLDNHRSPVPEPPPRRPGDSMREEQLPPRLQWLEHATSATLLRKDCVDAFVGAIELETGRNRVTDWLGEVRPEALLVCGICTDICVMDFVLSLLSARNHGLVPPLRDIVVYTPGCTTYDLPKAAAAEKGLPETAAHPRDLTHHLGLYFMAARGALLADAIV